MNPDSPLARLAEACGIEAGYHDIWGTWHPLSDDTARHLLAAMGLDVSDEHAMDTALQRRHAARWLTLAPPVYVLREGKTACLPLAFSGDDESAAISWQVRAEDGAQHTGELSPAEQELIEETTVDGSQRRLRRFYVPCTLPPGYHEATFTSAHGSARTLLIVTPRCCHPPPVAGPDRGRPWGIALQLYGVRSARNWGIGDLGDLARAATLFGTLGADLIAINPLHALFFDEPERASPYSPSGRCFANPLYLDVEAVADFSECAAATARVAAADFQAELQRLRAEEFVDYAAVAKLKRTVLAEIYAYFRARHLAPDTPRAALFRAFQHTSGPALRRHAVFEVLHEKFPDAAWTAEFRDPGSASVAEFTRAHIEDVEFHEYLQWLLHDQLRHVRDAARAGGMRIGLYGDLAVGSDTFGGDVWGAPQAYARDVSIGAPPDDFNLQGQVWGLPPWLPGHLVDSAYANYIAALRANMDANGALRIDHVIGLQRLFWVPDGASAADGAYVRYPLHDLLAILALESVRAGCIVIGEDLGTVSDQMRGALHDYGLLSYRVVYFSKHWHGDHSFLAPREFPPQSLVTIATHDLPTFAGFWSGHDLELRETLGLFPDPETRDRLYAERALDRTRLLTALASEDLQPEPVTEPGTDRPASALIAAVHRYAARAQSAVMMVQMEDVLGELEQANVPGTVSEQPNWRRRLHLPLEEWPQHELLQELARHLATERQSDVGDH
jgi:(1->4)-alpha-D-glucan 1-alpha-D-glucosylmutase